MVPARRWVPRGEDEVRRTSALAHGGNAEAGHGLNRPSQAEPGYLGTSCDRRV